MATKQEIFKQAMSICTEAQASEVLVKQLTELLEPKKGGMTVDIESIVKRDDAGTVTEIQCTLSGVWLPADLLNFGRDKNSKIIVGDVAMDRVSKQAYKIKHAATKAFSASKASITNDVLDEVITAAEGKALLAELSAEPDYSGVEAIVANEEA